MSATNDYLGRYPFLAERNGVWAEIARFVANDVGQVDTVVELAAGYGDFIRNFKAVHRIAFEQNEEMKNFAAPDVDHRVADATRLVGLTAGSIDLVFASNFLEHLSSDDIDRTLVRVHEVLKPTGRIALLQPNFRLCAAHYFDDPTHKTALSDQDFLNRLVAARFRPVTVCPGLLPFSMKSRLPKWPILVRAYLASPYKPNAAQMYISAAKAP